MFTLFHVPPPKHSHISIKHILSSPHIFHPANSACNYHSGRVGGGILHRVYHLHGWTGRWSHPFHIPIPCESHRTDSQRTRSHPTIQPSSHPTTRGLLQSPWKSAMPRQLPRKYVMRQTCLNARLNTLWGRLNIWMKITIRNLMTSTTWKNQSKHNQFTVLFGFGCFGVFRVWYAFGGSI